MNTKNVRMFYVYFTFKFNEYWNKTLTLTTFNKYQNNIDYRIYIISNSQFIHLVHLSFFITFTVFLNILILFVVFSSNK
jgi:hypothetical protein